MGVIINRFKSGFRNSYYWLRRSFMDPTYFLPMMILLFMIECILCIVIVLNVKYTEIDWQAYMSEVGGFLNGTRNYYKLRGSTGPLVYPAGFVYIYSLLKMATSNGDDIKRAQYIFVGFYLMNLLLIFNIYRKIRIFPPWVLLFVCLTSYRVHSIFLLRLFNDPIAMMIFYLALNFFLYDQWFIGCIFFSAAVSVKMNILLFSPALFILLSARFGLKRTIFLYVGICALIQLVLGYPFLMERPVAYIRRAFNFGRKFKYKWTVNWRFVPKAIFRSRLFHLSLFSGHILTLIWFTVKRWAVPFGGLRKILSPSRSSMIPDKCRLSPGGICFLLFSCNMIGMIFARSLHYQFYVWYYHSIPILLWYFSVPNTVRMLMWGFLEMAWNTYPSTTQSSVMMLLAHLTMLYKMAETEICSFDHPPMMTNDYGATTNVVTKGTVKKGTEKENGVSDVGSEQNEQRNNITLATETASTSSNGYKSKTD